MFILFILGKYGCNVVYLKELKINKTCLSCLSLSIRVFASKDVDILVKVKNICIYFAKMFFYTDTLFYLYCIINTKVMNLTKIIEDKNLDRELLATALFPENKFAGRALKRIEMGEALLDTEQIRSLAVLSGLTLDEIFNTDLWVSSDSWDDNTIRVENADFKASLDLKTMRSIVLFKGRKVVDESLSLTTITVKEYINDLNKIKALCLK